MTPVAYSMLLTANVLQASYLPPSTIECTAYRSSLLPRCFPGRQPDRREAVPKLHKRLIDPTAPRKTEVVTWDTELRGFGFRVRPSGHRSFIVQYRNAQGRTRKVEVGEHGRVTRDEARREARLILAEVERGVDPAEALQRERQADSVRELVEDYLERHLIPKKRQSTVREYARLLEKVILPRLGNRKVADVTRRDIEALHRDLRTTP